MNHSKSDGFATTNWSLVLAVMDTAPGRSFDALERLCTRYWFPVYASIRRHGNDVHQAEDLTQGFFEFVIEHGLLQRAQRDRGRFRNFILTSLNNFLHNHHDRATAAKRGGKHQIVPLDDVNAEQILASEPAQTGARGFVRPPLGRHPHPASHGKPPRRVRRTRARRPFMMRCCPICPANPRRATMTGSPRVSAMETGTLRVALHRFRHRFGELLRSEVAYTVADPDEVEEEIRYLLSVLADE